MCRDLQVLWPSQSLPYEWSAPSDPLKVMITGKCGHTSPHSLCVLGASRGDKGLSTMLVQGEKDKHTENDKQRRGSLCVGQGVLREKKKNQRTCYNSKRKQITQ